MIYYRKVQAGLSLVELMVAIALGLFITGVILAAFLSSSSSFRDLQKSGEQIENGRYALSLLSDDVRHAGFFGQLGVLTAPTAAVDPCSTPTLQSMFYPVQVYSTNLTAKAALPTCLPGTEVSPGSDVVVIRRADSAALVDPNVAVSNVAYLQANPTEAEVQIGAGGTVGTTKKASGTPATILKKDGTAAPIRRLRVHIYYVSPCSQTICGSGGGDGIPTLKRLELDTVGASVSWTRVPLVSGIEAIQVDLGVDNSPITTISATGYRGDGVADGAFVETLPTGTDWNEVVSMRIHLLARTVETVAGHDDDGRSYAMGVAGSVDGVGAFKRRVFSAEVRLNNVAGRRERLTGESE